MPQPKRTPDSRILETVHRWHGNITAAADELGIQAKNLRKRLDLLGVDVADVRRAIPSSKPSGAEPAPDPAVPIRACAAASRPAPVRLLPAHVDRLRGAKFDLCARFRVETDETTILAQFVDEAFTPWLAAKLSEPRS